MAVEERVESGDEPLVVSAQGGDRRALDDLIRRHDRWVRGVVYSTLGNPNQVDDVVQQVWTNVCQQIGTLTDPARWRSWLFRLARNAAIDAGQMQARRKKAFAPLAAEADVAAPDERPVAGMIADEDRSRIMQAIRALPAIYREPFILRHVQDWSYAQIGETLDLPVDTVETRLVRARRMLKESLQSLKTES